MSETTTKKVRVNKDVDVTESEPIKAKTLKDQTIQLTHEKAYAFLELETFRGERPVNDSHVQVLYDEWKRGRFMWEHVILASAKLGDTVYHINGQHTCWMRINIPASITARVRTIDYEVADEENLRRLYGVFDSSVASRTPGHIVKALLAGTSEMDGIWDSVINSLGAGMKLWKYETSEQWRRHGPHEVALLLQQEHSALAQRVAMFYQKNSTFLHLKRASVFAAMFATFDKMPSLAVDFWQPVADGLNLDCTSDARYRLREFLTASTLSSCSGTRDRERVVNREDMYRICINMWNKWRKSEKVSAAPRSTERRYKPI